MTATRAAASTPQAVQLSEVASGAKPAALPARALACKLRPKAVPKSPSMGRRRSARWPKEESAGTRRPLLDRLDRLAPRKLLRIVDLAQIQHVTLHNPPAADAPVLHNAESPVLLAVPPPNLRAQKQDGRYLSPRSEPTK